MSDHKTSDLIKAGLAAAARSSSLRDSICAGVAAVIPNRVVYWVLVRVAAVDGKRQGLKGAEMAAMPIGVVAARLRHEIETGQPL